MFVSGCFYQHQKIPNFLILVWASSYEKEQYILEIFWASSRKYLVTKKMDTLVIPLSKIHEWTKIDD